ncbi:MAG: nuclear transport factor 2 family protein [Mucilaginibacter sp.]|nr:nuclear transport factor 2 family protein [Mucilaginibacter sp.]
MKNIIEKQSAKEVVLAFVDALNGEDFKTAGTYLTKDMTFKGVLGSRDGAEAYMKDMEHMKLKYKVKKSVAEKDDVCLIYDLTMSGTTLLGYGWYHVEDGKISSLNVMFDPRPILEKANKN